MRRFTDYQHLFLFGMAIPLMVLNLWVLGMVFRYFENLITVLAIAAILAFLLNYPVQSLEHLRLSRPQAVILVLIVTLALLGIVALTVVPELYDQTIELFKNIPSWLEASNQNLEQLDAWVKARRLPLDLKGFTYRVSIAIESQVQNWATQAVGLAVGTVSGLVNGILVVVLAFYMLLYGDRLWQDLIDCLPQPFGRSLSQSLRLNFHNFFISQFLLSTLMAGLLTPIFLLMQVPFALLFSLLIGISQLIPLVGASLGIGLVVILIALQNGWLAIQVAVITIVIQQIKDNILAPKLMGNFTGLNPIWIFTALLMGGQIAGLLGVIVAVPLAGTLKDTLNFVRLKRKKSILFRPTQTPKNKESEPLPLQPPSD